MFVKICGITTEDALTAAAAAGADAVGFVFAESPRRVSPARAAELCEALPTGLIRVAVMRHPAPAEIADVLEAFAPDWLQTEADDFGSIALPPDCAPLPVYRNGRLPAGFLSADGPTGAIPRRLHFEGRTSGIGETADWDEAKALAARTELVLAGGLNAENVADAIRAVRPWGVDVSSGVEASPGIKDPEKMERFVARVRAMENEV